jgi:hypothetical protein
MTEWVDARRTIGVDWNGVLDTYAGYKGQYSTYPPRDGAKEFLTKLKEADYKVVIISSADPAIIRVWLKRYGMADLVQDVTSQKVPAIVYLDDRAVTFQGDFDKAFKDIDSFMTYWETDANKERR